MPKALPLLLDFFPNAAAAYSLRKLRNGYTGSAIQVRRESDDATQNIAFDLLGELDTSTLLNFVGWNLRGKSLFNFFYSSVRSGKKVKGFHDIYFTPMYARDTVKIISKLSSAKQTGLFHIVGNERISKFEFGQQVARAMEEDPNLVERSSFLDSSIAKTRTADLSLSNVKIKDLGMQIPTILSGIEALVKEADNYHA